MTPLLPGARPKPGTGSLRCLVAVSARPSASSGHLAPHMVELVRAVGEMNKLMDLTSNGAYGVAIVYPTGDPAEREELAAVCEQWSDDG